MNQMKRKERKKRSNNETNCNSHKQKSSLHISSDHKSLRNNISGHQNSILRVAEEKKTKRENMFQQLVLSQPGPIWHVANVSK